MTFIACQVMSFRWYVQIDCNGEAPDYLLLRFDIQSLEAFVIVHRDVVHFNANVDGTMHDETYRGRGNSRRISRRDGEDDVLSPAGSRDSRERR